MRTRGRERERTFLGGGINGKVRRTAPQGAQEETLPYKILVNKKKVQPQTWKGNEPQFNRGGLPVRCAQEFRQEKPQAHQSVEGSP